MIGEYIQKALEKAKYVTIVHSYEFIVHRQKQHFPLPCGERIKVRGKD